MTPSPQDAAVFLDIVSRDGWTIPEVGDCLQRYAVQTQASDETACRTLLGWLDAVPCFGEHATGRRFTRLQFVENSLGAAGLALTLRDFASWFEAMAQGAAGEMWGDWRPNEMLPYAPQNLALMAREARIEQLEHELHHMEVAANRARAEVNFVVAERGHHLAVITQEIHQLVSQDYENSASWRVTKPLRRAMNWSRHMKVALRTLLSRTPAATVEQGAVSTTNLSTQGTGEVPPLAKPKWASIAAPWDQPGYSTEAAWRVQAAAGFDRNDYAEWVRRYATPSAADLAGLAQRVETWASKPLISVLMTVEAPNPDYLAQAVASVQAQIYPHWELCMAVAANADPAMRPVLEHYARLDQRIKLVFGQASEVAVQPMPEPLRDAALSLATGDWITLLNAIDLIAVEAMFMLASGINEHKNWRILYSDEDKVAGHSLARCQPNFKPDWNPDLFYAQNFIAHLCAFEARLVRQVGGFDARYGDAAFFDLTLRCLEQMGPDQIGHVPHVLYHARVESQGVEAAVQGAVAEQTQALNAHFQRLGVAATAQPAASGYRISYALPAVLPWVSLIIPTKNNTALLRQCIDSILGKTSYPNYEILVVDNGSDVPETLDYLRSLRSEPKIRVIRDSYAFNYSALNNAAVQQAKGEIIGLINDDIEATSAHWLSEMVSHALRPGVGAVGARLWYPNHTLQHAGMVLVGGVARHVHKHLPQGEPGFCGRAVLTQSFTAVTGACLVVKKALYQQVGGLNERELAIGFNDVDFCLRLVEAGYRNVWTPYAELIHHESATRGQDDSPEKQRRAEKELRYMRQRWGDKLYIDPAYNPNLTDGHDDFSLAWPPRVLQTTPRSS